jgi:subtilisin family serine protease
VVKSNELFQYQVPTSAWNDPYAHLRQRGFRVLAVAANHTYLVVSAVSSSSAIRELSTDAGKRTAASSDRDLPTGKTNRFVILTTDSVQLKIELALALPSTVYHRWSGHHRDGSRQSLTVDPLYVGFTNNWLYASPLVIMHDFQHEITHHNVEAVTVMSGGEPPSHLSLTGDGVVVGVIDTGVDLTHCYFSDFKSDGRKFEYDGSVDLAPLILAASPPSQKRSLRAMLSIKLAQEDRLIKSDFEDTHNGHGTHTSGTAVGDDSNCPSPVGLRSKSSLLFVDVDSGDEAGGLIIPPHIGPLLEIMYNAGVRVFSNSWGTTSNTYSFHAYEFDKFIHEHDDAIVVFSAGNSGPRPGTVGSPGTAKNVITIGASQNRPLHAPLPGCWEPPSNHSLAPWLLHPTSPSQMANFSSRGPTRDGRLKPEFVAPGEYLLSARAHPLLQQLETPLLLMRGTSMGAPAAARMITHLVEYLKKHDHPNPSTALVKAALAVLSSPLPTGESLIQLPEPLLPSLSFFDRLPARQFAPPTRLCFLSPPTYPTQLTVSMSWVDPPAPTHARRTLVNNLDLRLIIPSSNTIHLGNGHLDHTNPLETIVRATIPPNTTFYISTGARGPLAATPHTEQLFALTLNRKLTPLASCPSTPDGSGLDHLTECIYENATGTLINSTCYPHHPTPGYYWISNSTTGVHKSCIHPVICQVSGRVVLAACLPNGELQSCPTTLSAPKYDKTETRSHRSPIRRVLADASTKHSQNGVKMLVFGWLVVGAFFVYIVSKKALLRRRRALS